MRSAEEIAKNLYESASGYGLPQESILKCIKSIPEDLLEDFLYTMYRIGEKSGFEALMGRNVEGEEE